MSRPGLVLARSAVRHTSCGAGHTAADSTPRDLTKCADGKLGVTLPHGSTIRWARECGSS